MAAAEKKMAEFCCSAEKGHVWKELGIKTLGRREVEVGTLLLGNDKLKAMLFPFKY